ncbi:hypothetical protein [Tardiphaga robiniae]|uniref:Uncharacterized protein n=1 Tax=Tardiphaga robiniae TaxID=943830 RepID=A0A7G6U4X4_9BRAD|nr:hypothetical protein [Tardiphaga robiniae]QND74056.1 hypothetical protein HB776_24810 [Tardiphaga robiniae]
MNETEQECIILNSAWDMIDGMVNWSMFVKHDRTEPTNMMFETSAHGRLFIILLGDFLSQLQGFNGRPVPLGLKPAPQRARLSDLTFLYYLRQVCLNPKLGSETSDLSRHIEEFSNWLEGEFIAKGVNLHSIDVITDIHITRYRYIKICGDIAKHNLTRLSTNASHIRKLLEASGRQVSEQEAYLSIETFFEWFYDDIFIYHSSQIAEFLNNIRWEIFYYLRREFTQSYHLTEPNCPESVMYAYNIPASCTEPVSKAMYWNLMNRVRARPWMHRFIVSDGFKRRY